MVNILEVDVSDLHARFEGKDKLDAIYELMGELNEEFAKKYQDNGIHTKSKQVSIRRTAYYLVEELMEGMNLLKNREWVETQIPVDEAHLHDEMADVLHYVFLLFIQLDIDAIKMFDIFLRKLKVNKFRLRTGY